MVRCLENWGDKRFLLRIAVSMYYSEYNKGVFNLPTRSYAFDTLFLNPANLPLGTPDVPGREPG